MNDESKKSCCMGEIRDTSSRGGLDASALTSSPSLAKSAERMEGETMISVFFWVTRLVAWTETDDRLETAPMRVLLSIIRQIWGIWDSLAGDYLGREASNSIWVQGQNKKQSKKEW
jgi:hypothetical protein